MVRYFYGWTPLVIVGTVALLSLPWLGLIALMIVLLAAVAALAWAAVTVPQTLARTIGRRWRPPAGASATPSPARRQTAELAMLQALRASGHEGH